MSRANTASGETAVRAPSVRVVEAVADAEGVDPTELETPLSEAVDGAALDRLFAATADSARHRGSLSVVDDGYEVPVQSDGRVVLE